MIFPATREIQQKPKIIVLRLAFRIYAFALMVAIIGCDDDSKTQSAAGKSSEAKLVEEKINKIRKSDSIIITSIIVDCNYRDSWKDDFEKCGKSIYYKGIPVSSIDTIRDKKTLSRIADYIPGKLVDSLNMYLMCNTQVGNIYIYRNSKIQILEFYAADGLVIAGDDNKSIYGYSKYATWDSIYLRATGRQPCEQMACGE